MLEPSWCSHTPTCERLLFPPNYFNLRSMSDYSVNLSNESPPRSATATPIIIHQPESTNSTNPLQALPQPPQSSAISPSQQLQLIPAQVAKLSLRPSPLSQLSASSPRTSP